MIEERLLEIAEKTVDYSMTKNVDQVQASTFILDTALTRYANSQIHQNVATKKGGILIKVVLDKKISNTLVNSLEEQHIKKAVENVVKTAKASRANRDFRSLPEAGRWTSLEWAFDEKTGTCSPKFRAEKVREAIDVAHSKSTSVKAVAGNFFSGTIAYTVANSLGVSAFAKISSVNMKVTVMSKRNSPEGYGTAIRYSRNVKDIQPSVLAETAANRSLKSINPVKLSPGEYQVVMSPLAVSTLVGFLGYIGFSATPYQDGQSFVKYNLSQQVFDTKLNVKDDSTDPSTLYAFPIDGEGVPKRAVELIRNGVVSEQSICHNSFTAGKAGKKSTGHALPPTSDFYSERPMPFNMIVDSGDADLNEEIAETNYGVFVTTFHYVNPVEPTKAILTGLTRNGTFLIEKGEISKPIMNMRFTDSMLSTLKDISLIGKDQEMVGYTTVPSMKVKKLRFVGVSSF
ncbi:MAG: TldD/PmbA family protein [Candidatus Bathyarchaeota archaeon]|jgi:predicted Zn-dependent protease